MKFFVPRLIAILGMCSSESLLVEPRCMLVDAIGTKLPTVHHAIYGKVVMA